MKFEKNGGMWFWRFGQIGGTFYVTHKPLRWWQQRLIRRLNTTVVTVIGAAAILYLKTL